MFIVVVYDISNDKRRTKLFKALKNFGTPVQFSAFECILNDKNLLEMQEAICKIIRRKDDKVRIYTLCNNCRSVIKNMGLGKIVKERDVIVI